MRPAWFYRLNSDAKPTAGIKEQSLVIYLSRRSQSEGCGALGGGSGSPDLSIMALNRAGP